MTRLISEDLEAAAMAQKIFPFLLIEMDFSLGFFRMCTGNTNIVWDDRTFQAGGNLLGISQVKESTDLAANGYTISLSPIPFAATLADGRTIPDIIYEDELKWRTRNCSVYYGFFSKDLEIIPDPVKIIDARMDKLAINRSQKSYTIVMSVETKTISLNLPRISRYTSEDQRKKHPGDRIFDNVTKLAAGYPITWGRASS